MEPYYIHFPNYILVPFILAKFKLDEIITYR